MALILAGIGFLWFFLLRGLRITIIDGCLEYREFLSNPSKISLAEIDRLEYKYVNQKLRGRRIRGLKILVIKKDKSIAMAINPKPFRREDLRKLDAAVEEFQVANNTNTNNRGQTQCR